MTEYSSESGNFKRTQSAKNPVEKRRHVRGTADSNVNAWHTLNQFKEEQLTVASGKLGCEACKETESES